MSTKIRILIADDHQVFSDGLSSIIRENSGLAEAGCVKNGQELIERLRNKHDDVDVVLMDIRMPLVNGLEATSSVKEINPAIKVLIMTGFNEEKYLLESIRRKADGFISKNRGKNDFIDAIYQVFQGRNNFFALQDEDSQEPSEEPAVELPELTATEKRILCYIVREQTSQEISDEMGLTVPNVEKYRRNIMAKLGVKNVAGMVRVAVELNICNNSR